MSWLPIETAPRGERVLVWGVYDEGFGPPESGAFTAWVEIEPYRTVYLDPTAHSDEYPEVELVNATHWMPLPEPPK